MKAEDTVMANLADAILRHPDLPMGQAIAIEQAEISFKAGIKEVVEWIESLENESGAENVYETRGMTSSVCASPFFKPKIFRNKWQSKLEEWGIEGK